MKHRHQKENLAREFELELRSRCFEYIPYCDYVCGRNIMSIRLVDPKTRRKMLHLRAPVKGFPQDETIAQIMLVAR